MSKEIDSSCLEYATDRGSTMYSALKLIDQHGSTSIERYVSFDLFRSSFIVNLWPTQ